MFAAYNRLLLRRPIVTNMVTTGFLFGAGDLSAQAFFPSQDQAKFNFKRLARTIIFGGVVFAPIGVRWYLLLGKINVFRSTLGNSLVRVAADQLIFAPFIGIPLFYSVMACFELNPNPVQEARTKLEKYWWTTLRNNWTVWPAFQLINFALVPAQFKLLAVNLFSIGWNCYLSYLLNLSTGTVLKEEPDQIMM